MQSKRTRLDRFLSTALSINRKSVRLLLAQGRVLIDHQPADSIQQLVDEYTHVQFDQQILQAKIPSYIMLHKPAGVVSATKDPKHKTVIDVLAAGQLARAPLETLHLTGRLDFNSTGLLLLTNDGRWSRRLASPEVKKRYRVTVDKPISPAVIEAFAEGIYFPYEGVSTRPAELKLVSNKLAEVTLREGRYHQIKRMFGRFQIEVLSLHRFAVGALQLDPDLQEGKGRPLSSVEVSAVFETTAGRENQPSVHGGGNIGAIIS